MGSSIDVTQKLFPIGDQIYDTKVVFYAGYFVSVVNLQKRLRKPEIRDGSKRSTTQHNDKLRSKGFIERRLAKRVKKGKTFFVKKASDPELTGISV